MLHVLSFIVSAWVECSFPHCLVYFCQAPGILLCSTWLVWLFISHVLLCCLVLGQHVLCEYTVHKTFKFRQNIHIIWIIQNKWDLTYKAIHKFEVDDGVGWEDGSSSFMYKCNSLMIILYIINKLLLVIREIIICH